MDVFWKTIAEYNEATWLFQIIITVIGITLTILLYQKPTILVKRLMKGYMVFINGWIAIVYYMMYCSRKELQLHTGHLLGSNHIGWLGSHYGIHHA